MCRAGQVLRKGGGVRNGRGLLTWVCGFAVLLAPVYGLAIVVLVWLARRLLPGPAGDLLQEFKEHVAPTASPGATPLAELPLVQHLQVQPLIDLLDSPDLEVRKAVLEAMSRRPGRRMVECIQSALQDPRPEIYQYAVAKLAQIQENHSRELARARAVYQRSPSRQSTFVLVAAYQNYLDSGLLEPTLEPLYLGQLNQVYADWLAQEPGDQATRLARAEVLSRLDRHAEARQQYAEVLRVEPDSPQARLGLVETAYQERDWEEFHQQLRQLQGNVLPSELRERVDWLCR